MTADLSPDATSLIPLFRPRAVAVIGVSRHPAGIGRRVFEALRQAGYPGAIHAIGRGTDTIDGQPVWPTIREAPPPIDLAVIAVPRDAVLPAIDDCAEAGVKAVVVISAGFAEADDEGRALQDRLVEKVRAAGMRMVGPNCMGVINADARAPLNASFSPRFPRPGGLAMSSQSGALGIVILELAARRHVGVSTFVSVGNKADVSSNDLLEYWDADPDTRVVALYLESFGNPRKFARIARDVSRRKPIIAVKAGRTGAGSRAAGSHTAALAASDVAVDAMFHQTGVMRAATIDEMFDLAACLEAQPLPRGRRVGIVTNAGGPGILAADACEGAGLQVVPFTPETSARLRAFLPAMASAANPLDMIATAGPDHYRQAVELVLTAPEVDALIVIYTPVDPASAPPILDAIRAGIEAGRAAGATGTPVVACLMAAEEQPVMRVGAEHVPVYAFPENAARALGTIASYAAWRRRPTGGHATFDDLDPESARELCRQVIAARGEDWLTPDETRRLLSAYGLDLEPSLLARSPGEAVSISTALGFPVVAKLAARTLVHKSDVGGVLVGLKDTRDVTEAFATLVGRAAEHGIDAAGVSIQPMTVGGIETMVGVTRDRLFGSLVGFGLGGTNVEVLGDLKFRVVPLSDVDIEELTHESAATRLLDGYRGRPPADRRALSDLLARVSRMAEDLPELLEMDLNPVLVLPAGRGCRLVDVRVRVGHDSRRTGGSSLNFSMR